jgi:hypothetical protein
MGETPMDRHGGGFQNLLARGNRAIYSIQMPLVFGLCKLVCDGVAQQAAERAAALRG